LPRGAMHERGLYRHVVAGWQIISNPIWMTAFCRRNRLYRHILTNVIIHHNVWLSWYDRTLTPTQKFSSWISAISMTLPDGVEGGRVPLCSRGYTVMK